MSPKSATNCTAHEILTEVGQLRAEVAAEQRQGGEVQLTCCSREARAVREPDDDDRLDAVAIDLMQQSRASLEDLKADCAELSALFDSLPEADRVKLSVLLEADV